MGFRSQQAGLAYMARNQENKPILSFMYLSLTEWYSGLTSQTGPIVPDEVRNPPHSKRSAIAGMRNPGCRGQSREQKHPFLHLSSVHSFIHSFHAFTFSILFNPVFNIIEFWKSRLGHTKMSKTQSVSARNSVCILLRRKTWKHVSIMWGAKMYTSNCPWDVENVTSAAYSKYIKALRQNIPSA